MKRFHVHVGVEDLAQSIRFYSTLFATEPTVIKDDYAKWMLEDPRVNFAISTQPGRGRDRACRGLRPARPGRASDCQGEECDLLLRQFRQAVDRRPAGRALG